MTIVVRITKPQQKALDWLNDHGGDGAFVQGGATIIAQGEIAPHQRETWVALRDARRVEFYNGAGRGYGRVRIVKS
jgi:hypothetical protein